MTAHEHRGPLRVDFRIEAPWLTRESPMSLWPTEITSRAKESTRSPLPAKDFLHLKKKFFAAHSFLGVWAI